jgi:HEAT repeat protein
LGTIHQQPEQVIPILVEFLDKPQNPQHVLIIRSDAIWALREFGPQAKSAIPSLLRYLNDEDGGIRSHVTNALIAIDPEAAAKAGVK